MKVLKNSENDTKALGVQIGQLLSGGEVIELIGDVGAGKTTLTKGVAVGLGIDEYIQSPSFTINRVYEGRDNITLSHYDFYRLEDAGIMANELKETIIDTKTVTIIEWGEVVTGLLPKDRLSIKITSPAENSRNFEIISDGTISHKLKARLKS